MKRWITFLMTIALLFTLCACGSDHSGAAETANEAQSEPQTQDAEKSDAWREAYRQQLQCLLDEGTPISGAWVYDVDGDGVPSVALSLTQYAVHPMPEYILNSKNGRLIIKDDVELGGTGGSINNQALFASGTDYLILREQGMTVGTFLGNNTAVWTVSPQTGEYTAVEEFSVDTTQIEQEADGRFKTDPSASVSDLIDRITEESDQRIAQYAPDGKFFNYADEMTWFADLDENDIGTQMQKAVMYFKDELGITLQVDETVYADLF